MEENNNEPNEEKNLNEQANQEVASNQAKSETARTENAAKAGSAITGIVDWVKSNTKIVIAVVAVLVVILVGIMVIPNLIGSPEKAVKNYVSALNSGNANKLYKSMDAKGVTALEKCSNYFGTPDFEKFKDKYDDLDKDDVKFDKEDAKKIIDALKKSDIKNYSIKVVDIKDKDKIKECKDLYKVKAKVRVKYKDKDGDKQDTTEEMTFYVYKNKVIGTSYY